MTQTLYACRDAESMVNRNIILCSISTTLEYKNYAVFLSHLREGFEDKSIIAACHL
jgi:hypothetical protein